MTERRHPWSSLDPEDGPTLPLRRPDDLPSLEGILTDDDIDEVRTTERRVPLQFLKPILPRTELTGTITLPKSFLASEPVTLRKNPVPTRRVEPPPKPRRLPPPPRFEAPAPPAPAPWRAVMDDSDLAPTPILELPPPTPPIELRSPPRKRPRSSDRPRPPEPERPASADATREAPLQAPGARTLSVVAQASPAHPSQPPPARLSHPPPPMALSSPPPAPVASDPHAPSDSFAPPARDSFAPPWRARHLPGPRHDPNTVAAAYGVTGALVFAAIAMALWLAFRSSDVERSPPSSAPITRAPTHEPAPTTATAAAARTPAAGATTASAAAVTTVGFGTCALLRSPTRIASPVMANVRPIAAPATGSRVALGYASAKNRAEGVLIDLENLAVEPRYSEEQPRPVARVTPLIDRAPVAFAVDHEETQVTAARTIPSSPPIRVAATSVGLVRLTEGMAPTTLWTGGRSEAMSEPSFTTTDRDGHGIAFRSGRTSGDVWVGWLTPSGTADGDLQRIDAGPREVGTPVIATDDRRVVVVFPARAAGEAWRLRIASAPRGKLPKVSQEIEASTAGAGDAFAPAIVALPRGGWLLTWLEGPLGARRIVARTLDDRLAPVGLPVEIATGPSIQDNPGTLVVRGDRVLSVYLNARDKLVELVGSVLRCR